MTANVSGTHANPAVTLALALYRGFAWKKVPLYWAAQLLGAFLGAILVYTLFQPVIDAYNQTHRLTRLQGGAGGVFFTSPGYMITPIRAFFNEIILTAILLLGIFAITEEFNEMAPGANAGAFMIGMLIAAIGASAGYLEGWPLNPARDFGPRLFAYFAGWGEAALPAPHGYWWVPIAGPMIGGVIGAGIYQYLVWPYLPRNRTPQDERQLSGSD